QRPRRERRRRGRRPRSRRLVQPGRPARRRRPRLCRYPSVRRHGDRCDDARPRSGGGGGRARSHRGAARGPAVTVYLVGAGPGDPGLLTGKGAEVLGRADVVVSDRLSVASLLGLAPDAAERISVGKAPGRAPVPQSDINALLVARGRTGATVVRLKGG